MSNITNPPITQIDAATKREFIKLLENNNKFFRAYFPDCKVSIDVDNIQKEQLDFICQLDNRATTNHLVYNKDNSKLTLSSDYLPF